MTVEDTSTKPYIHLRDRVQKPAIPIGPDDSGDDGDGPKRPKVDKPETEELLRRMRRVDKDQSRRYRQRTGECRCHQEIFSTF